MSQLTKRAESIVRMQQVDVFACPHCEYPMTVQESGNVVCENRHTFDVAKQGYIFMLPKPINSMYTKELFEARHEIISSGLYDLVQQKIAEAITINHPVILDTGCGEGSHLARICERLQNATGVGIDIAKEGIVAAAKFYRQQIWCVGDLAKSPFQQQKFDVILNFLSPANYDEFKRLVKPNGMIIKVVPQENYLQELRTQAFANSEKENYSNEQTVARFKESFEDVKVERITYTLPLETNLVPKLLEMTPMGWHIENREAIELSEITIDLDVLIGRV